MSNPNIINVIENADYDEAYDRVLPEAKALATEQLVAIRLDIPAAIITAVATIPRLVVVREYIDKLPLFNPAIVSNYTNYVLALASAQSRYLSAIAPADQSSGVLEAATERRDLYWGDAQTFVAHGLINPEALKEIKCLSGYKNVAFDLMSLVRVFKSAWPNLAGKTAFAFEELAETNNLAWRLVSIAAQRAQSPEDVAQCTEIRQRMFTLFASAHDQVRRATIFLRWDYGDADEIAPSLYAGRPNTVRKNGKTKPETEQPTTATATPAVESKNPAVAPNAKIGMPDSDPLMSA